MLPTLTCEHCESKLNTANELATEICEPCRELLSKRDSYAGVCWKCNRITMIQSIPKQLKGYLTEKYLFTKECSHCTGLDSDDMAWVTMKTYQPASRLIVSEDGELLRVMTSYVNKRTEKNSSGDRPRKAVLPGARDGMRTPLRPRDGTGQHKTME